VTVLEALNTGARFGKQLQARSDWWVTKSQRQRRHKLVLAASSEYRRATERLRSLLRSYVDEWIDTAMEPDGAEIPLNRDLSKTQIAQSVAHGYIYQNPPKVLLSDVGNRRLGILFLRSQPIKEGLDHPVRDAEEEATRLFALFQASDWCYTIAKCRGCGKYYQIKNPARRYKRGTYHRRCGSRASAERATSRKRKSADERLLEIAADQLRLYHGKSTNRRKLNEPVEVWLAEQLTEHIARDPNQRPRQYVKRNWVTLHKKEIEKRTGLRFQ
jgi:hypothetical protein